MGVPWFYGLDAKSIRSFIANKKRNGEDIGEFDLYAEGLISRENMKGMEGAKQQPFLEYLRVNGFVREGAEFRFEKMFDSIPVDCGFPSCTVQIGSLPHSIYAYKEIVRMIKSANNDIERHRHELLAFIKQQEYGPFEWDKSLVDKIKAIQTIPLGEHDLWYE